MANGVNGPFGPNPLQGLQLGGAPTSIPTGMGSGPAAPVAPVANVGPITDTNPSGLVYLTPNRPAKSYGEAVNYFKDLDVNSKKDWAMYAGLLDKLGYPSDYQTVQYYAGRAIDWAAANYASGKSVFDFFTLLSPNAVDTSGRNSTTNTASTSVNETSRTDAAVVLNNSFQQMLGRMASGKEIAAFQQALNEMERKNPNKSNNTTTTSSAGRVTNVSSSTKSSGGFNASQFGVDWAMSRPEYAENFAATSFMGLIGNMIQSGASLEGKV